MPSAAPQPAPEGESQNPIPAQEVDVEGFSGAVIIRYSRQDALDDGTLVDVSETAKEAGFLLPVAVTAALWADMENFPENSGQDVMGRLWDVLWVGRLAVREAMALGRADGDTLRYGVILPIAGRDFNSDELYIVKSVVGPGDEGEPVITLMKSNED